MRLTMMLAAGLVSLSAFGQDKPAAMTMPKPASEMKELRDLIGVWNSDEKFESSTFMPGGGTATGVNTVRLGPGGFSVLMDQRSKGSMGPFVGHGVFTWDPNDKLYRFVWTDSMSPGVMTETGRKEGDRLVFTGQVIMMGKKVAVRDVMSDKTPASYTLTSYMNDGSGEKKVMTLRFTKQDSAKK